MRAVALLVVAGCGASWVAPPPEARLESVEAAMESVWRRAADAREERFAEALAPGSGHAQRLARLRQGELSDFQEMGERLFALDTPWRPGDPTPPVVPIHSSDRPGTADATRCQGCHHLGGDGGSGGFGDLALFDVRGDDVLTGRRRLPPMLAGAALLERAAAGHPERQPFGWSPASPSSAERSLRGMVRWSVETHLRAGASDEEIDALTAWIALLPPPLPIAPAHDSLILRAANGAALFAQVGCADCHVERLTVDDPVLPLSHGRSIDLRRLLSRDGRPPYTVAALTDLKVHRMGPRLADGEPEGDDRFVTAPLWGVATRGPLLHDGRAATLHDAVVAHGGEAQRARDAYLALGNERSDLQLYLATLGRPPVLGWVR